MVLFARGLPVDSRRSVGRADRWAPTCPSVTLKGHPAQITQEFGWETIDSPFLNAGVMWRREVWTRSVDARYDGTVTTLGDVLQRDDECPSVLRAGDRSTAWQYLKGAKREERTPRPGTRTSTRRGVAFPEPLGQTLAHDPDRGRWATPSRFKHVVADRGRSVRRLTPVELERLNGFPDHWTDPACPRAAAPS